MSSGFASLHPLPCFLYYAGVMLLCMLLFHPIYLLTALIALDILCVLHHQGQRLLKLLPFYLVMGGSAIVLNPLFSHRGRHILFYFWDQPITLEAVLYGLTATLSMLAVLITFQSFNYIITPDKFMYLFARALPKTSLLALMTIRFVPLFKRRLRQIELVQGLRGVSVRQGSLRKRMRDGMTLLRVLLVWSLEDALQTADSMKARGYGTGKRSAYIVYRMDRRDIRVLLWLSLTGVICAVLWLQGFGTMKIYPRLEPLTLTLGEAAQYVSFCAFLLTPVGLEWKERLAWK
ncbi:energy-coupling factor transporter transmembrane component T [Paenibacillus cremeus]|uniref:Energy-coupling factor transporter transmembrane protein EcfT n=1 Tax=Paenibacillus cremeus TaxID=2163881 RepID=A0A559K641_9BACL|nr:energy-coupling factor transporter transmembrane component T [Paenibacillus cremeus]TVY07608.1 energy-coupling factor transporter transmembrane protein EcfT [Paenibacillus cremeus]